MPSESLHDAVDMPDSATGFIATGQTRNKNWQLLCASPSFATVKMFDNLLSGQVSALLL